jgi:hypothetical protein
LELSRFYADTSLASFSSSVCWKSTRSRAAPVIAALDRLSSSPSPQARIPVVVCGLILARAEQSRLEGRSDPERWRAAEVAWERLAYPFEAAYVRFRQAEALLSGGPHRTQAETMLGPAHQTAVALGAAPLRREIELLAQRGCGGAPARPRPAMSVATVPDTSRFQLSFGAMANV